MTKARIPVYGIYGMPFLETALDAALSPSGYSITGPECVIMLPRKIEAGTSYEELAKELAAKTLKTFGTETGCAIGIATISAVPTSHDIRPSFCFFPEPRTLEAFSTDLEMVSGGENISHFLGVCIRSKDGDIITTSIPVLLRVRVIPEDDLAEINRKVEAHDLRPDGSGINHPLRGVFRQYVMDADTCEKHLTDNMCTFLATHVSALVG